MSRDLHQHEGHEIFDAQFLIDIMKVDLNGATDFSTPRWATFSSASHS
jgi:hypothetical protein